MVKRAPSPSLAVHLDAAAVQLDRHLYQVETDPGADDSGNVAAAVIAFEQMNKVGGRDADAAIGNPDNDVAGGDLGLNRDRAAMRRIFDGVGENVAEHLEQELGVTGHRHRRRARLAR